MYLVETLLVRKDRPCAQSHIWSVNIFRMIRASLSLDYVLARQVMSDAFISEGNDGKGIKTVS